MLQQKKPTYAYVLGYVTYLCNKKCISVGFIVAEINIFQKAGKSRDHLVSFRLSTYHCMTEIFQPMTAKLGNVEHHAAL